MVGQEFVLAIFDKMLAFFDVISLLENDLH